MRALCGANLVTLHPAIKGEGSEEKECLDDFLLKKEEELPELLRQQLPAIDNRLRALGEAIETTNYEALKGRERDNRLRALG